MPHGTAPALFQSGNDQWVQPLELEKSSINKPSCVIL